MPIDPKTVDPKRALEYIAVAAQRVLPLADSEQYNAAVNRLSAIIDDYLAREAIAADKAKEPVAAAAAG